MDKKVNFYDFLDIIGSNLIIKRYNNQNERWTCSIEYGEIKDSKQSSILSGTYGDGKNPKETIYDYINQIQGKLLIIDPVSKDRKEYNIPNNLYII